MQLHVIASKLLQMNGIFHHWQTLVKLEDVSFRNSWTFYYQVLKNWSSVYVRKIDNVPQ